MNISNLQLFVNLQALKKNNYQNDKQEHLISIATSIKAMLLFKPNAHQVDK
jgi:hypothetical protein